MIRGRERSFVRLSKWPKIRLGQRFWISLKGRRRSIWSMQRSSSQEEEVSEGRKVLNRSVSWLRSWEQLLVLLVRPSILDGFLTKIKLVRPVARFGPRSISPVVSQAPFNIKLG